jgi:hypothetical protein
MEVHEAISSRDADAESPAAIASEQPELPQQFSDPAKITLHRAADVLEEPLQRHHITGAANTKSSATKRLRTTDAAAPAR